MARDFEMELIGVQHELDALKEEISRHVFIIQCGKMIEFRSYYRATDPTTGERVPVAKASESPALLKLATEAR